MRGQSSRVMLNGGLSPLRFTRKTKAEHKDLRLVAAGQGSALKASPMFKSFPPKVIQNFCSNVPMSEKKGNYRSFWTLQKGY